MPFRFNPFTDRLDLTDTGGSGGSGITQLTPDDGGAVTGSGGNVNVFGITANTVPVVETHNITGDFGIENRTWLTQYVVDPSGSVGLQGTFSTIQSAIDQAVIDGTATSTLHANIFVRNGTYNENLVLPDQAGINLVGFGQEGDVTQTLNVNVVGNVTNAGVSFLNAKNIYFLAFSGTALTLVPGFYSFDNCLIQSMTSSSSVAVNFTNCNFTSPITLSDSANFKDCTFSSTINISGGTNQFNNCVLSQIALSSNPTVTLYDCYFTGTGGGIIIGTFSGNLGIFNCGMSGQVAVNGGNIRYSGLWSINNLTASFFAPGFTPSSLIYGPSSQGNVLDITKVAADYTLTRNDYYIGVTDTTSARTLTLPNAAAPIVAPFIGQVFIIKDESGAAATNNITLTPNGGTIDGAGNYVINTNYGSVELLFDGTNYFIVS